MRNISYNADQGYLQRTDVRLLYVEGVLSIIISVVGFLANIFTIVAILRTPKLRNAASYFLISSSATDLLLSITLPFYAARYLGSQWVDNKFLCVLIPFLFYGTFTVCLFAIAGITVNRFIKIVHSDIYEKIFSSHNVAAIISFEWIFGFSLLIPTLYGVWGNFGYDPIEGFCEIITDKNGLTSRENLFIIVFLMTFAVIAFCYARILHVVIRSSRRISSINSGNQPSILRRMKMAFIIFVAFIVCFLPISLIERFDENFNYGVLHVIGRLIAYCSSIINPIIYVVMNKQYKAACLTLLQYIRQALRLN